MYLKFPNINILSKCDDRVITNLQISYIPVSTEPKSYCINYHGGIANFLRQKV